MQSLETKSSRPKSFETETRSETFETETQKNWFRDTSRDRDWLQALLHWCDNNAVFIVDVSKVCANSRPQKTGKKQKQA